MLEVEKIPEAQRLLDHYQMLDALAESLSNPGTSFKIECDESVLALGVEGGDIVTVEVVSQMRQCLESGIDYSLKHVAKQLEALGIDLER